MFILNLVSLFLKATITKILRGALGVPWAQQLYGGLRPPLPYPTARSVPKRQHGAGDPRQKMARHVM
jgi:hypothetical protein